MPAIGGAYKLLLLKLLRTSLYNPYFPHHLQRRKSRYARVVQAEVGTRPAGDEDQPSAADVPETWRDQWCRNVVRLAKKKTQNKQTHSWRREAASFHRWRCVGWAGLNLNKKQRKFSSFFTLTIRWMCCISGGNVSCCWAQYCCRSLYNLIFSS